MMCSRKVVPSVVLAVTVATLASCVSGTQPSVESVNEKVNEAGFVLCVQTLGLIPRVAKVAKTIGVETVRFAQTLCRLPSVARTVLDGNGDEVLPTLADEACSLGGDRGNAK
jgi:hypothetical protein